MGKYTVTQVTESVAIYDMRKSVSGPVSAVKVLMDTFPQDLKVEHFRALYLDTKNRPLANKLISVGSLNASILHPREVFTHAVRHSAASFILAHNHPTGDTRPSIEDIDAARRMGKAGELMGIQMLDFLILGWVDGMLTHYSGKEHGDI